MRVAAAVIVATLLAVAAVHAESRLRYQAAGGLGGADIGYHANFSTELSGCAAFDVSYRLTDACAIILSAVPMTVFTAGNAFYPEEHRAPTANAQALVAGFELAESTGRLRSYATLSAGPGRCETHQGEVVRVRFGTALDASIGIRSAGAGMLFALRSTNVFAPPLAAHGVMLMLGVTLPD